MCVGGEQQIMPPGVVLEDYVQYIAGRSCCDETRSCRNNCWGTSWRSAWGDVDDLVEKRVTFHGNRSGIQTRAGIGKFLLLKRLPEQKRSHKGMEIRKE